MVRVHNDAAGDLRRIALVDAFVAARLAAFIQQLRDDPQLVARLLDNGYGEKGKTEISVKQWTTLNRAWHGRVFWRVRSYDLESNGIDYRFLYLYNWRDLSHNILAVVLKDDFDYDKPSDPIRQRVLATARREFPQT